MNNFLRRSILASGIALVLCGVAVCGVAAGADEPAGKTVSLTVDYGDGVEKRFTALAWTSDTTAFDVLVAASKHARGITFQHRGQGLTAFVTQIDDVKNEGGGKRNWIFKVNGTPADRGCGVYTLAEGDAVLWYFGMPE